MIPKLYEDFAILAAIRYTLADSDVPYFDHWFHEKYGFSYGHSTEPLRPDLQEVFHKHKQPAWIREWYNEYEIEQELLTMLTQPQIQNTIVFLSRTPTQGVQEASELVSLVQLYQSLLPEQSPTVPESDSEEATENPKEDTN